MVRGTPGAARDSHGYNCTMTCRGSLVITQAFMVDWGAGSMRD